jgi:hypothetical protein
MIQTTRNRVFMLERSPHALAACARGGQYFQSNVDATRFVVGAPHLALPPCTEFFEQRVAGVQAASVNGSNSFCHGLFGP